MLPAGHFPAPFLTRAATEPDRVLFRLGSAGRGEALTHGRLAEGARRFAGLVSGRGVRPGETVFVALKTSPELYEAFLGVCLAGAVPALLPPPSPKQDPTLFWTSHAALFRHVGAPLLVASAAHRDALHHHLGRDLIAVAVPEEARGGEAGPDLPPPVRDGDIACLQHSSGTTGLKKGVPLTHRMITRQVASYAAAIGLTATDPLVSWLPLYHDMGFVACLLAPLVLGCPVATLDPFEWLTDPLSLLELAAATDARFTWLPNFAFQHLVNAAAADDERRRVDLGRMRAFVNCSEPCKPATTAAFAARFASWGVRPDQIATCYTMAEATFAITSSAIGTPPTAVALDRTRLDRDGCAVPAGDGDDRVELLSCGRPIPGAAVAILDRDRLESGPLAEGRLGEIAVAGDSLFAGYHGDEARTRDVLRDGRYLTGDLGLELDGELFVLGRRDDLVIVLGRNLFAHEVEALVAEVPGVKPGRAVAFGIENIHTGSQDLVIVAELDGSDTDSPAVRGRIRTVVESTVGVVPGRIALVEGGWLIKTTSGKVSRGGNREKFVSTLATTA